MNFLFVFIALVVHETGHAVVARLRGFVLKSVCLMPYGAMMSAEENFDKTSGVLIGLAGPLANFVFALLLVGVWWLFPSVYGATRFLLFASVSLGIFNLLPCYPLDGSRIILSLSKNKLQAIKVLRVLGVVFSIVLLAGFIVTLFFNVNFSLGIMAVFLFYGAAFGSKDETYIHVLNALSKDYSLGVERKTVKISADAPIVRYYHHESALKEIVFEVVDDEGEVIKTLTEEDVRAMSLKNKLSKSFNDIAKP
ncbi:MAG: site-2 protease family protein [Clostridia bacterium]|nr:site-2 protease family protein [Clostridia bacterium]